MKTNKITVTDVKKIVASKMGVDMDVYENTTRKREVVEVKHLAIFLCDRNLKMTEQEIVNSFGLKQHSNVVTTRYKINGFIETDQQYKLLVSSLQNEIDNIKDYNSIDVINTYILGKSIN